MVFKKTSLKPFGSFSIEVHDINQRLNKVLKLLKSHQFNVLVEKEESLKHTIILNL